MARVAEKRRTTRETDVAVKIDLDGRGTSAVATGIGFLDHMLDLFARHGLFDLEVTCAGDLQIDGHHSVEDIAITLGQAFAEALGDKRGIVRYGVAYVPMDEALARAVVDLSGRAFCVWNAEVPAETLGTFNAALAEEFWRAVAGNGLMNLHVNCHYGRNAHHVIEAIFKAAARALRQAVEIDPRGTGIPSTKGVL